MIYTHNTLYHYVDNKAGEARRTELIEDPAEIQQQATCVYVCMCVSLSLYIYIYISIYLSLSLSISIYIYIYI